MLVAGPHWLYWKDTAKAYRSSAANKLPSNGGGDFVELGTAR